MFQQNRIPFFWILLVVATVLLLAACGGGGGGGGVEMEHPPARSQVVVQGANAVSITSVVYQKEATTNWGIGAIGAALGHWGCLAADCLPSGSASGGRGAAAAATGALNQPPPPSGSAWRGRGVTIAVMDDGLHLPHPEFSGRVVARGNEVPTRQGTVVIGEGGIGPVIEMSYQKTYGAASATIEVLGTADVTLYAGSNPVLTLTVGMNTIANDYSYYGNYGWLVLNTSAIGSSIDPTVRSPSTYRQLFEPFTPQNSPTYYDVIDAEYKTGDHGTHVAGIAAAGLDGDGVVGVAPEATVLPLKLLGTGNNWYTLGLQEAFEYAVANNAFVVNNSWGYRGDYVKISLDSNVTVTADRYGVNQTVSNDFIWAYVPWVYDWSTTSLSVTFVPVTNPNPAYIYAVQNTMLLVFAHGNDGWNSETGRVRFCVLTVSCYDPVKKEHTPHGYITLSLDSAPDLNGITVYGVMGYNAATLTTAAGGFTVLDEIRENQGGFNTWYPLYSTTLSLSWLNVVAVDSATVIAYFSNGCGVTKDFCLAAPGFRVSSSIYEYEYDASGNITNTVTYAAWSGTSMAAPHVSGAAALLKGFFPNLSPADVAKILKESADGLRDCAGVDKSVYCVDEVYGHGMLNVSASFTPTSTMSIGGGTMPTPTPIASEIRIVPQGANAVSMTSAAYQNEAKQNWGIGAIGAALGHWGECEATGTLSCPSGSVWRGRGVTIAVMDDGLHLPHPEFSGRVVARGNNAPTRQGAVVIGEGGIGPVIEMNYWKTYGAVSATIEVHGTADVTMYTGINPVLTLTVGMNTIANDYRYYSNYGWLALNTAAIGSIDPTRQSPSTYRELFEPFTPQMSPTYYYGSGRYNTGDHGTHVAGIAAAGLDGDGIVGVAPEATVLPLKNLFTRNNWDQHQLELREAFQYAAANGAFVVNNSWGYGSYYVKISLDSNVTVKTDEGTQVSADFIWVDIPAFYRFPTNLSNFLPYENSSHKSAYEYAVRNTLLLVFSQGNDGWNTETGEIDFCVTWADCYGSGSEQGVISLGLSSAPDLNGITVYGVALPFAEVTRGGPTVLAEIQENQGSYSTAYPLYSALLSLSWLNVVAVDSMTVIASISNGCGATKDFCLAAPGVSISSSIYEDEYDSSGNITNTVTYAAWDGTSMAAPHVSGAAALLKGFFPNLSPADVAAILKDSADGLGICAGVKKSVYCVDEVYGHGMLNVSASFAPTSTMSIGGGTTAAGAAGTEIADKYALAHLRVNLSPVFGAAGWQHSVFTIGALDNYDRVYPTYMSFATGAAVVSPVFDSAGEYDGTGIERVYGSPLTQEAGSPLPSAEAMLAALDYDSTENDSGSSGGGVGFGASLLRQGDYMHRGLAFNTAAGGLSWRARTGDSSHLPPAVAAADFWQPVFSTGEHHRLAYSHGLSALPLDGTIGVFHDRGERLRQSGVRLSFGTSRDWQLHTEAGMVAENGQVLGATFSDGLGIESAATRYRRLSGLWQLPLSSLTSETAAVQLFASYIQTDTTVAEGGGVLTALHAEADALSLGANWGGWQLLVKRPLVITSGEMRLSAIDGYDESGAYRVSDTVFDLSAGSRRPQTLALRYRGSSQRWKGLDYVVGVSHTKNAPRRQYNGDSLDVSAALRWRF